LISCSATANKTQSSQKNTETESLIEIKLYVPAGTK